MLVLNGQCLDMHLLTGVPLFHVCIVGEVVFTCLALLAVVISLIFFHRAPASASPCSQSIELSALLLLLLSGSIIWQNIIIVSAVYMFVYFNELMTVCTCYELWLDYREKGWSMDDEVCRRWCWLKAKVGCYWDAYGIIYHRLPTW